MARRTRSSIAIALLVCLVLTAVALASGCKKPGTGGTEGPVGKLTLEQTQKLTGGCTAPAVDSSRLKTSKKGP